MSARRWSADTLRKHARIAIDADVLIYLLEDIEPRSSRSTVVIDLIDAGFVSGSMATVGLTEVLVGPARGSDAVSFERTADELRALAVSKIPLTAAIAEDAAWLRGRTGLGLADAAHIATARAAGATAFVTNDRRIPSSSGLEVYYLDDLDLKASNLSHV